MELEEPAAKQSNMETEEIFITAKAKGKSK